MTYRLLHSGFDQFDIAFQGAPSFEVLEQLREAKEQARITGEPTLAAIGPQKIKMHVAENGKKGGYAFSCDTGPTGEHWWFKDNNDQSQWNIMVSVHSKSLLCKSLAQIMGGLREALDDLECRIGSESVSRIDFAMDFLTPDFEPCPELFITHPRTKIKVHWSKKKDDDDQPSAVLSGRQCESVTIGKMPGRQVIVYDKRRDSLDKGKFFWFRVWDLDPKDTTLQIWRVELRAGKDHLKDSWNLRSFDQVFAQIGGVFEESLEKIRYVLPDQLDTNVSRQQVHPIWAEAKKIASEALAQHKADITPDDIREIDRQKCIDTYIQQIMGNSAGLAAALGYDDATMCKKLSEYVARELEKRLKFHDKSFWRSFQRARDRLHFQNPDV